MSTQNTTREIEVKLRVDAKTLDELVVPLSKMLGCKSMIYDIATDLYWKMPKNANKFVRLRDKNELTVKTKDKGSNFNREEINLKLVNDGGQSEMGEAFMTSVFGPHNGSITKEYWVFFVPEMDVVVSLYEVFGLKKDNDRYIEIESTNEFRVLEAEAKVIDVFRRKGYKIQREEKSLYELYIK